MSHEIETHGDQAAAIFARTNAWHDWAPRARPRLHRRRGNDLGHLGGCYAEALVMPTSSGSWAVVGVGSSA